MEIADLVVINKFDGEYKPVCRGLQRKLTGALSLTMSKHHSSGTKMSNMYVPKTAPAGFWHCPVELVSAENDYNVDVIWKHAHKFKECMGDNYLLQRRQLQTQHSMWNYLSAAVMQRLKNSSGISGIYDANKYADVVSDVEQKLL